MTAPPPSAAVKEAPLPDGERAAASAAPLVVPPSCGTIDMAKTTGRTKSPGPNRPTLPSLLDAEQIQADYMERVGAVKALLLDLQSISDQPLSVATYQRTEQLWFKARDHFRVLHDYHERYAM
jgi:hypothetical protein